MRVGECLYFSPKFKFENIEWNNPEQVIDAFSDRVNGFYLSPASSLCAHSTPPFGQLAFSTGVLCVSSIDFIARYETGLTSHNQAQARFITWLGQNAPDFKKEDPQNPGKDLATRFYFDFRCGLIHEGRIKNGGQFSFDRKDLIFPYKGAMVVNPQILLKKIESGFFDYTSKLQNDNVAYKNFFKIIEDDFKREFELTQQTEKVKAVMQSL